MKRFRLKTATKLALTATAVMLAATGGAYLFLFRRYAGLTALLHEHLTARGIRPETLIPSDSDIFLSLVLFSVAAVSVFFVAGSAIIDRAMNPMQTMIRKIREIERNLDTKIFVDSSESELLEYALAFNNMTARLSEYIARQRRFTSDVSHELTTPITVIVGHADLLLRRGRDDPELLESGLLTIRRKALAMNTLIEDLLFFARSDRGRQSYHMRPVDLAALISECVAEQRLIRPDFAFSFDRDTAGANGGSALLVARCDAESVKRVLHILFDNAVRYGAADGRVETRLREETAPRPGGERPSRPKNPGGLARFAEIRVSDHGVGIEQKHLSRIFERFYRVDDSRSASGGSGLGLAIAKEIVEAHGGFVRAHSRVGAGTAVSVRLPLSS